jgi:Protein of unknown function (DUF3099)
MLGKRKGAPEAVRITSARANPADDLKSRQRTYVISMTIRTACFVGAVLLREGWLCWVLVVGAVFLPYAAVIMANASGTREDFFSPEAPVEAQPALPGVPEKP